MIKMDKVKFTLLLSLAMIVVFTSSALLPMSIYQWDEPLFYLGETTVIRRDLLDTVIILSLASFLASFILLAQKGRKAKES